MQKIKEILSNKLNLLALFVVLVALVFGGYKYSTKANGDDYCTFNITKYRLLKDQTRTGCGDISWGEWKTDANDEKWEVRKGTGVKTIVDYGKKEIVSSKTETRNLGGKKAFETCWRTNKKWDLCNSFSLKLHITGTQWNKLSKEKQSCYIGPHLDIDGRMTNGYQLLTKGDYSEKYTVQETTKLEDKIDNTLRNDSTAKSVRTNIACQVEERREIPDEGCSYGPWSPERNGICSGIRFKQTAEPDDKDNCDNITQYAFGNKDCGDNYCKENPSVDECQGDDTSDDDTWVDTGVGFDDTTDPEDKKTQEPIEIGARWSTDTFHWHDNFDRLILLKRKSDKVYFKIDVGEGTCNKTVSDPVELISFNFLPTTEELKAYDKQDGSPRDGMWYSMMRNMGFTMNDVKGTHHIFAMKQSGNIKKINSSYVLELIPTEDAPLNKTFKRNIKSNYCDGAGIVTKELRIKIAEIEQEEV